MDDVNIYFEMQLDEERILADGVYYLDRLYNRMDEIFAMRECKLEKIDGTKRIYTRHKDKHDFEYLIMCARKIEYTHWFEEYACHYMFYIYDEGELDTEENWLEEGDFLQRRNLISGVENILSQMNRIYRADTSLSISEALKRRDTIKNLLQNTDYQCMEEHNFILFHKKNLCDYKENMRLISANLDVDCKIVEGKKANGTYENVRCGHHFLRGTYDNTIVIAALICLMLKNELPDSAVVAFTLDTERTAQGINQLVRLLKKSKRNFRAIVLDVTNTGWDEECDYTVENCYLGRTMYRNLIYALWSGHDKSDWKIIPEDRQFLKGILYTDDHYTTNESIQNDCNLYRKYGVNCFSFCLPASGTLESVEGVKVRIHSLGWYLYKLIQLAKEKI